MSGWQLGLALVGCFLAGVVSCGASIYFYARHVWKQKMGLLAGAMLATSTQTTGASWDTQPVGDDREARDL